MPLLFFKWFKKILPPTLGILLIYYSYINTTPLERIEIYSSMKSADYKFVLLSICLGILSHLSRSIRWQSMLRPLGYKIKILNSIMSVLIAFLSNLGMPRSGEFLRASSLSYYEKIPFEKSFGTIVTERIIDVIILIGLLLCGVMISSKIGIPKLSISNELILSITSLITLLSIVYYVISKTNFKNKFKIFISGLKKGVLSVSKINNKPLFVFHSLFIWICYFLMFYVVKFSLPETYDLGFEPLFIAFLAGAMAMALTNGGIGVYPLAIAAVISQYEISYESALALGWIVWTSQTLMIITFGSLSFVFLPILNK
ncbi:flippase-like domain-containing protein [bacterium]|nr:flippase-like domain-containing protein [Flavobacteriaceae bacterium]MDA9239511.1 flippase-like domain-containing protein [bacterium]MDB4005721.1 flippase-like domain-containing protein [Flavobacteriaceae bacterium]